MINQLISVANQKKETIKANNKQFIRATNYTNNKNKKENYTCNRAWSLTNTSFSLIFIWAPPG